MVTPIFSSDVEVLSPFQGSNGTSDSLMK